MHINFKNIHDEDGYIIPISIIMYLNETYDDRDISQNILHYFLCYLKDEKNNNLLESYRNDFNEIKIALNGLSNKNIEYNAKLNNDIVNEFCEFVKYKENNINILIEYIDDIESDIDTCEQYDKFCTKLFEQKLDDEEIELNIIEDKDEKNNTFDLKNENNNKLYDQLFDELSVKDIFSKYFTSINESKQVYLYPEFEWNKTSIRFKKQDGTWDKWVDLKGATGKSGGGSKGMNREQVNELIKEALSDLNNQTYTRAFAFFCS